MKKSALKASLVVAGAVLSGTAVMAAGTHDMDMADGPDLSHASNTSTLTVGLPEAQHQGEVSWVSGGVSQGQARVFKQASDDYPLTIQLLEKAGKRAAYTADAQVRVIDDAGRTVLDARADGPYMLVRVPPGTYRIRASLNGHTLPEKTVTVGDSGTTMATMIFPPHTG